MIATPITAPLYFREHSTKPSHKKSESSSNLLAVPSPAPMASSIRSSSKDEDINPWSYALNRISLPSTPAHSRPASIHNNSNATSPMKHDEGINPYAYALNKLSLPSTPAHSRAPSMHRRSASKAPSARSNHSQPKDEGVNPVAYALGNSWMWRRSLSRSTSAANSRSNSVHA